jgi:acetolactate synthase-1/3 small subunit
MQHNTLIAKVENKPGVLNRVASLFRRNNFNIESLNVGRTESPDISRMTIVMENTHTDVRLVEANLYKLVNVIDVQDVTNQPSVVRDLALIKVTASPENRSEIANLASIFRANIVDVAPDSVIIEITGTEDKIESLVELLRPMGIIELVRTGQVAMLRGQSDGIRHTPGANGGKNGSNGHKPEKKGSIYPG